MTSLVINVPGEYISLGLVLQSALEQASKGKGKERHASVGEAYEDQIICEVTRRLGSGYPLGQAVKKIYEAQRLGGEKGIAELLGAINYIAASVIVEKEELEAEREEDKRDREFLDGVFAPYAEKPKTEGVEEPKFKAGDKVQARSLCTGKWEDAVCLHPIDGGFAVKTKDCEKKGVFFHDLRPAPKAEGVEELVVSPFDEERMRQSMPGIVPQDGPSDFDAPRTKEELYDRIVANNPAVFGRAHNPTDEELAEMAEEDAHE